MFVGQTWTDIVGNDMEKISFLEFHIKYLYEPCEL